MPFIKMISDRDRFFKYVEIIPFHECWEWIGCKNKKGYGWFTMGSRKDKSCRPHLAHRISYELHRDPIPIGLQVLHECDNTSCVNPKHLFIGTNFDNVKDKIKKERQDSKLTKREVIEIRQSKKTQRSLALEYVVSIPTINRIINGLEWKHI